MIQHASEETCRKNRAFICIWISHRNQSLSFSLCRRLPTDNVSGQLQFKVDVMSTNQDGEITHTCTQTRRIDFSEVLTELDCDVRGQISGATSLLRSSITNTSTVMDSVTAEVMLTCE